MTAEAPRVNQTPSLTVRRPGMDKNKKHYITKGLTRDGKVI